MKAITKHYIDGTFVEFRGGHGQRQAEQGRIGHLCKLDEEQDARVGIAPPPSARSPSSRGRRRNAQATPRTTAFLTFSSPSTFTNPSRYFRKFVAQARTADESSGQLGKASIVLASCGVAGCALWRVQRSAATLTSSALLLASRSLVIRMLSSRPVRIAFPARSSTHSMTSF